MNRSHLWKFLFVLFTVFSATTEILPYKNRNLVEQFDRTARLNPDKALADIVGRFLGDPRSPEP